MGNRKLAKLDAVCFGTQRLAHQRQTVCLANAHLNVCAMPQDFSSVNFMDSSSVFCFLVCLIHIGSSGFCVDLDPVLNLDYTVAILFQLQFDWPHRVNIRSSVFCIWSNCFESQINCLLTFLLGLQNRRCAFYPSV